jgi:biotin carboxyl carrier protein
MELIVTHGERQERVQIRHTVDGYEVQVGETTYRVDSQGGGHGLQSFLVRRMRDGAAAPLCFHHEVFVEHRGDGAYGLRGSGPKPVTELWVADPLTHLAQESHGGGKGAGKKSVAAYMPGRVVALLAAEGDEVKAGQGILVLEAMKMENEIPAEASGIVAKLLVTVGQAVDAGDPLFEIA